MIKTPQDLQDWKPLPIPISLADIPRPGLRRQTNSPKSHRKVCLLSEIDCAKRLVDELDTNELNNMCSSVMLSASNFASCVTNFFRSKSLKNLCLVESARISYLENSSRVAPYTVSCLSKLTETRNKFDSTTVLSLTDTAGSAGSADINKVLLEIDNAIKKLKEIEKICKSCDAFFYRTLDMFTEQAIHDRRHK